MEKIIRIEQLVVGKLYLEIAPNELSWGNFIGNPNISERFKMIGEPYDYKFSKGRFGKFFKALPLKTQKIRNLSVLDCGILSDMEPTYHNNHRTFTCSDEEWNEVKLMTLSDFFNKCKIQQGGCRNGRPK